jgi:hypothetical protein
MMMKMTRVVTMTKTKEQKRDDIATGRIKYRGRAIGTFQVPASEFADFAAALERDGTTTVERTDEVAT